jgi:tRNA pseudouridine32 synthase/23S rRNA pseudouridine746 synthase
MLDQSSPLNLFPYSPIPPFTHSPTPLFSPLPLPPPHISLILRQNRTHLQEESGNTIHTSTITDEKLWAFSSVVSNIPLPEKFTFPFYYEPHPLCIEAAQQLQEYLKSQEDFDHNFGLKEGQEGLVIGKMFGVLVVKTKEGDLAFLAGFSGKLANSNHHKRFVPPVFDILKKGGFFRKGEEELNAMNRRIEELEALPEYIHLVEKLRLERENAEQALDAERQMMKAAKKERKRKREAARQTMTPERFEILCEEFKDESLGQRYVYKKNLRDWTERIEKLEKELATFQDEIDHLKATRKKKSSALQQKLFQQYAFLNYEGKEKSLGEIFELSVPSTPPSGAGECAAPKLLQYAYLHDLEPIAMAEFWWGQSPSSEVRKHKHFYPACRGKCEPILGHMLQGLETDENPLEKSPVLENDLEILYEDDHMLILNKPAEFLSVPGKQITDSVYTRMKNKYPYATGPLVVHRLDMSTSGLMVISKSKEANKELQHQFIKRKVQKRYVALLDGLVQEDEGFIDLPLRVDLDDRPRQLVCYEYGKSARTRWKVVERKDGKTRIHFFPITGRTHQLRVHAAHPKGLNVPIVGDDLYGTKANRLHLHAAWLQLSHPATGELMEWEVEAEF